MNKLSRQLEISNKINELKVFEADGVSGKLLISTFDGIHGKITFDNYNCNMPFAHENDGSISYLYSSFKYTPVTKIWIEENIEPQLHQLINEYRKLDQLSMFRTNQNNYVIQGRIA